jgi:hypothetical protein
MKNLSRFDLGMIIAFAVVALLGGGAWYYLSGQLTTAQGDVAAAAGEFDQYTKKEVYLPTGSNVKTLQSGIDQMTAQLDPLMKNRLESSQLEGIQATDTVEWKHQLDDEVHGLNNEAKISGITVPANFYYGFSRYLNTNPTQDSTVVLSRQLIGVKEIADTLIKAPVHAIIGVRRTYEEDPVVTSLNPGTPQASSQLGVSTLAGHSQEAAGGVYTAYPFEVEFDADTEAFRQVINGLMQSHYVFVIRSVMVQNSRLDSPRTTDLDTMAGTSSGNNSNNTSLINSSPGAVAAAAPTATVGLQYLFGNETLHIRMRIDLIDWHGLANNEPPPKPAAHGK